MAEHRGLLSGGWDKVGRNKRYVIWFYVLNLALAWLGAGAFSNQAHEILDHSLQANRLVHGFDLGVLIEMFARPEFGSMMAAEAPAMHVALLFFIATALFLPGVLQGYASTFRLPREDFFRACGRNLWRFIRLLIVAGIVMGAVAAALFSLHGLLEKKALESTNELLLFEVRVAGLVVIFLVMTALRIWVDLAQADVVLSDQRTVRRSIGSGFRHAWRDLGNLLGSYVLITIVAAIVLVGGLWIWMKFVPPASVHGAVFVSQVTLLLLLIPRFWQRGVAVTYYLQNMVEPIAVQPLTPLPGTSDPAPAVVIPSAPPQGA
ncbi:MAG: hypothetical protein WB919_01230 [Candidatus Sulfotelmatobacter sp.]